MKEVHSQAFIENAFRGNFKHAVQKDHYIGAHLAMCVDTKDPWKQNRVRYYSPILHRPDVSLTDLPWAWPVSVLGGFDDSGVSWVPPAGSTLVLLFINADPNAAIYIGTTWQQDRGQFGSDFPFNIPEYNAIWNGHRGGYLVGPNDESQANPPWNTDQYQGYDINSTTDVQSQTPNLQANLTTPHQYGFRTNEKHTIKLDDGDPSCNRRGKKIEVISSKGQYILLKDDPYNPAGSWTNPKCGPSVASAIASSSISESAQCTQPPCSTTLPACDTSIPEVGLNGDPCTYTLNNAGTNCYFKHAQECGPFFDNRCALPQNGILIKSRAGHISAYDDSVEQPQEGMGWEESLNPPDLDGCTQKFRGRMFHRSATGHVICLNDTEDESHIRGANNGILIQTAAGNTAFFCDETTGDCTAGQNRGIHFRTTSNNTLDMGDAGNPQCSPDRDGCGEPTPQATNAMIQLRTGYGLVFQMADFYSQQETQQQYIKLFCPQTDNEQRGPHIIQMQEAPDGPGQIFVRSGGDYIAMSYDDFIEVVGDEEENPSDKMEVISGQKAVIVQDVYFNQAKTHLFQADDYILLLAGKDGVTLNGSCEPTVYRVVVACSDLPPEFEEALGMKASERVFASAHAFCGDKPCEGQGTGQ